MRTILSSIFFLWMLAALPLASFAKLEPGPLFSDGMVMQQRTTVNVWGWADAGSDVTLRASWREKALRTKAGADGRWQIPIETPAASFDEHTIELWQGSDYRKLRGVLVGEVWIAAGQSNMEMPVEGWQGSPVEGAKALAANIGADGRGVRVCTLPRQAATKPAERIATTWQKATPKTAATFSAVGATFADQIFRKMNVPVGLVVMAVSNTPVEAWMPADVLRSTGETRLAEGQLMMLQEAARPMVYFNGMVNPVAGYAVRGFLWYQGESNVQNYFKYARRLTGLIGAWRYRWQQGDLPFLIVEIAPYLYNRTARGRGARLREAQWKVADRVPNTWAVTTNDLALPSEAQQLHPSRKKEVGERLAALALNKVYGKRNEPAVFPRFRELKVEGDRAVLTFRNAEAGFDKVDNVVGFELCGPDNIFHAAKAVVQGDKVVVTAPQVSKAKSVHYCFQDFLIGNLKSGGRPLVPFRTEEEAVTAPKRR